MSDVSATERAREIESVYAAEGYYGPHDLSPEQRADALASALEDAKRGPEKQDARDFVAWEALTGDDTTQLREAVEAFLAEHDDGDQFINGVGDAILRLRTALDDGGMVCGECGESGDGHKDGCAWATAPYTETCAICREPGNHVEGDPEQLGRIDDSINDDEIAHQKCWKRDPEAKVWEPLTASDTEDSTESDPRFCCAAAVRDAVQLREAREWYRDHRANGRYDEEMWGDPFAISPQLRAALSGSSETPQGS